MSRKIAIVARAATAVLAPFHDPSWEIWGMPWVIYPREPDLLFDVHSQAHWDKTANPDEGGWISRAQQSDARILCDPSRSGMFPGGEDFPFAKVHASAPELFFENTVAYQLGYALMLHKAGAPISEIMLYGVHMSGSREYLWERASVIYLVGLLQGHGVKVSTAPGAPLFMSYWMAGRYGVSPEYRFAL